MSAVHYFVPVESTSPSSELIISFVVPDRKYVVFDITTTLPSGVSMSDFPAYQTGDLIRIIVLHDTDPSFPGDTEMVQPMNLYESETGNYVNVMVYSSGDRKHEAIRSKKKYN